MKKMTPKDLNKISKQADDFKEGKLKFDTEISRWQEDEHFILSSKQNMMILLAKHMCAKLTDMIDFTCGQGPLNTTKDVVEMASQLSKDGNHLDRLAHDMMKQYPDESLAKKNVLAYLEQIPFYCNQLTVNAKVQTDDQCLPGILNLIETANNLTNTVVCTVIRIRLDRISTVKSSYIGSLEKVGQFFLYHS